MLNRLKTSLVLIPIVFLLVVGAYVYSLWAADRQRSADLPVEGASMMMRDLLAYHKKRGGFPGDLKELEGVIWEKKNRQFASGNRALNHRNYYYLYTRVSNHQFSLWAIPFGKSREEAPTWFLLATSESCRRWKGPALPLEQAGEIDPNPSLRDLGVLGLIEQPPVDLKGKQESTITSVLDQREGRAGSLLFVNPRRILTGKGPFPVGIEQRGYWYIPNQSVTFCIRHRPQNNQKRPPFQTASSS